MIDEEVCYAEPEPDMSYAQGEACYPEEQAGTLDEGDRSFWDIAREAEATPVYAEAAPADPEAGRSAGGGQHRVLDYGTWNGDTSWSGQGGQLMRFEIKNVNILGTTIQIDSNLGGSQGGFILPQGTITLSFTCFGAEPMGWRFDVSTNSDAFIVAWTLYSTWIPGDPPNG